MPELEQTEHETHGGDHRIHDREQREGEECRRQECVR
jgi:hypothetical protein